MKLSFIKLVLFMLIQVLFLDSLYAKTAHQYVEENHDNIVAVILSEQHIYEENPERFISSMSLALNPLFDFKRISRSVMGKYYKMASLEQREKFQEIFKISLLRTYSKTLAEFKNEKIIVLPDLKNPSNPERPKVHLEIITHSKVYPAMYSMYRNKNSEWKVINIIINGVNLGLTFRNQYYSLMESHSHDTEKVIEEWVTSI